MRRQVGTLAVFLVLSTQFANGAPHGPPPFNSGKGQPPSTPPPPALPTPRLPSGPAAAPVAASAASPRAGTPVWASAPISPRPRTPISPRAPRGPTARSRLTFDWHYPVGRLFSEDTATREPLTREAAFAFIAEGDTRPLLVLRECVECRGTDNALLRRAEDNEKTVVLSRWFRCVKLPPNVVDDTHSLRRLFPEDHPPHLFLSKHDGSDWTPLQREGSRATLWKHMLATLRTEYRDSPKKPVTLLFKMLDKFDMVDEKIAMLEDRVDRLTERYGKGSTKLAGVQQELDEARAERDLLRAEEQRISELELVTPTVAVNQPR